MSITVEAVPFLLKYLKEEKQRLREEGGYNSTEIEGKELETVFTDKEVLIKTLKEHGATDIKEIGTYDVTCIANGLKMYFSKPNFNSAYTVKVSCNNTSFKIADNEISELTTEYSLNVQEATYLHLIEKLKENNMTLESETVQEDNTIVLTINID